MLIIEEGKPVDRSRPGATVSAVSAGFAPMLGMQLIRGAGWPSRSLRERS